MKVENVIGSPLNGWFAYQQSLNWRDNHAQTENIYESFLEALRLGVSQTKAFYEIANRIARSGKSVKWHTLNSIWCSARDEWRVWQHVHLKNPSATLRRALNGHGSHQAIPDQVVANPPASKPAVDILVIDGTNVIYGSAMAPALMARAA